MHHPFDEQPNLCAEMPVARITHAQSMSRPTPIVEHGAQPTFPSLHIFYANRSLSSPALTLIIDALRYPNRASKVSR